MKFIHLSDLHIGKSVSGKAMLEEQRAILFGQIIPAVIETEADGVIIAGDVFDRANPAAEAIALFDDFLAELAALPKKAEVFIISGNHDGAERIAYGSRIMDRSGIHLSPVYDGTVKPFTMRDAFGELDVYMLPFIKKATVKYYFPEAEIESENDSVAAAVAAMKVDPERRNVCIAHQFVSGAMVSGSEEANVGGLDAVSPEAFRDFDYVALGHIHGPQDIVKGVRYCGSPLKYSFSEVNHKKSISLVEIGAKGDVAVTEIPLVPMHDWYDIRGTFEELTGAAFRAEHPEYEEGYLRVTLTDENDVINGYKSLQSIYHNMMELHYDNSRTRSLGITCESGDATGKTDEQLVCELFRMQNGRDMNDEELEYIRKFI